MLIKLAILLVLILILGSLFSALFFLARDKGASERTAKALTVRVVLSILLFLALMLGYASGLIGHA
ncbi:MAG TPA: twin transmembrane helix small protein [Methylophilaceae bacterium]|jgi:hypothetical protein